MKAPAATSDGVLGDALIEAATDQALLARFVKGDRAALGELAARYERALLGLSLGIVGDRDLALDAVQEAWVRVIRFAKGYRRDSSVKTWLYRISINAARNARSRSVNLSISRADQTEKPATGDGGTESREGVRAALLRLPDDRRLIVLLCYHHDLTHPQAADVLGIPLGTLKSRLHAALTDLREHLREESAT